MSAKANAQGDDAFRCVENMLSHIRPKQDTAAIMQTLRERFVSADALFSADAHVLEKAGLHPHDALLLSCMPSLTRYLRRASFDKRFQLCYLENAGKYLVANFYGYEVEHFFVLHLDARGRLIECTLLQEGMVDCSLFNLKKLLSDVVRLSSKAVIISHNHPGGTLRPSQEDIDCTLDALRALGVLGVPLLDHIIIAGSDAVSLRQNGFIPASVWAKQAPQNRMLQNYLSPPEENKRAAKRKQDS